MHGQEASVAGEFAGDIAVMQEMHWSWSDLLAAPINLVEEIAERIQARNHWQRVKSKQEEAKIRSKSKHG